MKIQTEQDIIRSIENDEWMMDVLQIAKSLELPDWWICAGFVRSKIWDTLHNYEVRTTTQTWMSFYFDSFHKDEAYEQLLENNKFGCFYTLVSKNQARMHVVNNMPPYSSSIDAISKFPETATALGVTLDELTNVILTAPCGIEDVLSLQVRPTAIFLNQRTITYVQY